MIFYQNYRKEYINPYRTGVKIGNYNEDLFGEELKDRYKNIRPDPKNYISESMDKYKWPKPTIRDIQVQGNDFTNTQNSNFDLNIVFTPQNFNDYMKLYHKQETNPYILENKNRYLPEELEADRRMAMTDGFNIKSTPLVFNTQRALSREHIKDTKGLFNTRQTGIYNPLLTGHGCQRDFNKTEYQTMYNLTISQKEKTDKILHPKYKIKENWMEPPKEIRDNTDWGFRNYKIVGDCSKKFDKIEN